MKIQRSFIPFLILSLVSCKPMVTNLSTQTPNFVVILSPVPTVSTSVPDPPPEYLFTNTATLSPTDFYLEYHFDWLISEEASAHRGDIVQAGSSLLFTSEEHPDTPDSYTDLDISLYTEGKNDFKLSFVKDDSVDYQLLPVNGAKVISVDFSNAKLEACINADYSSSLRFISLKAAQGNYFCVFTSDQRFSLVHIDEVNHLGDGSLRLSFVTYKKDTDK